MMRQHAIVLIAFASLLLAVHAASTQLVGKVLKIPDGDTITVLVDNQQFKVRLAEIDTPERRQPWGNRAKQALADKVFGEVVRIDVVTTDRYGRTVGHIRLDGRPGHQP
jgi:endonuclease YncB( thermonuclease family)